MKLRYAYKFFDTEEAARDFCDRENRAHPRRKNQAHYTPWSSSDPRDTAQFVAWYYVAEGAPTMKADATRYEIRQVDAIAYDDGWSYNETWNIGTFATASADVPRAFRRALANLGVSFHRGRTVTEYDGDLYEIVDRKTREPLFVAVPQEV